MSNTKRQTAAVHHPIRIEHAVHTAFGPYDILAISVPFDERYDHHPYEYQHGYVDSAGAHMALCERIVPPTPGSCSACRAGARGWL